MCGVDVCVVVSVGVARVVVVVVGGGVVVVVDRGFERCCCCCGCCRCFWYVRTYAANIGLVVRMVVRLNVYCSLACLFVFCLRRSGLLTVSGWLLTIVVIVLALVLAIVIVIVVVVVNVVAGCCLYCC